MNYAIQAFDLAVSQHRLSRDPTSSRYVGYYLYTGPALRGRIDTFRNWLTHEYLSGIYPRRSIH